MQIKGFFKDHVWLPRRGTRPLAGDERGVAVIEFALIATPLIALMIAIIQTSMTFFAQQTLETATEKATRTLFTGSAQSSGSTQAQYKALVCSKLPVFMKCANLLVDVQSASSFSSATLTAPTITYDSNGNVTNTFKFTPGTAGSINVVRIMYIWNTQKGPLGFDLSTMSNGNRLLLATSVFKVEPYQ